MHNRHTSNLELYKDIELPCGSIAYFDHSSGISYRCYNCMATVGSIGMPRECKSLFEQEQVIEKLKGKNGNNSQN